MGKESTRLPLMGEARAYQALVLKPGGRCPTMEAGTKLCFEGSQVLPGAGSVCANVLQDLLPQLKRMDLLLELGEAPSPTERVICTTCKNRYRAAELELVYMPYGHDGEPDDDADMMARIAALKGFEVMAPLPSATIERIAHTFKREALPPGEILIAQGQEGKCLYLVEEGSLEVTIDQDDGKPATKVAELGSGTCVGEMSLLTGQAASATVRTTSQTSVLTLEARAFHSLLVQNPGMNIYFAQLLVKRIQHNQTLLAKEVSSGMSGELSTMSPQKLLQALNSACCTGKVRLESQGREVEIHFSEGDLVQVNPVRGVSEDAEEVVYDVLSWTSGSFEFEASEEPVERTFFKNLLALMLEGTRRFDEKRLRDL